MDISLNTNQQTSIQPNATDTIPGETNIGETQETNSIDSILNQALEVVANAAGENGAEIVRTFIKIVELDDPDSEAMDEDIERLVALLQLEEGEVDAANMKDRIKQLASMFDSIHEERQQKIDESIEKQKEADKAAKRGKILSIFGAIFAIVAAVVVTVVTGGVAAGFAIAGACLAVAGCVLSLTEGDKAIMDKIAEIHQKLNPELSEKECKEFASDFYTYFGIAACAVCAIGGLTAGIAQGAKETVKIAGKVLSEAAKKGLQYGMQGMGLVNSAVGTGFGVDSMYANKDASEANAKLKEIAAFIQKMQKEMDDAEELLEKIVEQIQSLVASLIEVLDEVAETKEHLLDNPMMA